MANFDTPPAAGPHPWPASEDDNRGGGRPMSDPTRAIPDMTWPPPTDPTISTSLDPMTSPEVTGPPVTPSASQPPPPPAPQTPKPPKTARDRNDDIDAGPSLLDGLDTFGRDLPDDEDEDGDEDYHPPAPPPLPRFAGITVIGMLGIIVGIAVIIYPALLPMSTGFAEILGGRA